MTLIKRCLGIADLRKFAGAVALGALVLLGSAVPAKAVVYSLTEDHCTSGCGTAPFGTVTLTQNGANVDITVALAAGNSYVQTGAGDFQVFKFNGVGIVVGDITIDAHVPALAAATGALNGDGTGTFAFGINCPSCGNGGAGAFTPDITFHVANATIADLTVPNNLGLLFVADMLSGTTGNTGPVGAPGTPDTPVPEPTSVLLLGTGLALAAKFLKGRIAV